ncbi:MAG: glycosyltransferase family 2 protein [Pseudonocardiaceae bacterium]
MPATSDPSWGKVWSSWDVNPKAYWWHSGKRTGVTALPPKKTRQLIWATYQLGPDNPLALLSYIDADSVVPADYFWRAAAGMRRYDVIQYTNISGNLLRTFASSFFSMDHICWDASLYKHMTANGKHPFYVLGKGLFFRFCDVLEVGGFHPWLTIEDPEIGLRFWTNGARLGVVESPLIEEVPHTFTAGIHQRKRWIAGFFQTLGSPLTHMGMTAPQRWRARLNFVPTLSLLVNPLGFAIGMWALIGAFASPTAFIPIPLRCLCILTVLLAAPIIGYGQLQAWRMSKSVLPRKRDRYRFLLRVNPLFLLVYWLWWTIPIVIGLWMFWTDGGLVWERTTKIDANSVLIRGTQLQRNAGVNAAIGGPMRKESRDSGPVK